MSETAVAEHAAEMTPAADALESHLDDMFADEEIVEEQSADEQAAESDDGSAVSEEQGSVEQGTEGTTDKDAATAEEDPTEEPETVEALKEKLAKLEADRDAEIAKLRTSIDKQGNRFMGITEKNKALEAELAQIKAQRQQLGERPDFLEDHEGATIHAVKSNDLKEREQSLQQQINRNAAMSQRYTIEQQAAMKFAPKHAEMVSDLHALWKRDVPEYGGTLQDFEAAMYSEIPASAIISMTKRVEAERERDDALAKLQETIDKFTNAGKKRPHLVGAGSGQATDTTSVDDTDDDDVLAWAHNPSLYKSK